MYPILSLLQRPLLQDTTSRQGGMKRRTRGHVRKPPRRSTPRAGNDAREAGAEQLVTAAELPVDAAVALDGLLGHALGDVAIFDRDSVVVRTSRPRGQFAGAPAEQVLGHRLRDRLTDDGRADLDAALAGKVVAGESALRLGPDEGRGWTHTVWAPLCDPKGHVVGGLLVAADATLEKTADELLEKFAFIDPVTGLPNRAMLAMMLSRALSRSKVSRRRLALVWLNLDRFKDANDALGPEVGDGLLRAVGERLRDSPFATDLVARVGGDDFALLLPRIDSMAHLRRLMEQVQAVFSEPFSVSGAAVVMSASCGVALHSNGAADAHKLQEHAHSAMRLAKRLGGGGFEIFTSDLSGRSLRRLRLDGEIRRGIAEDQFVAYYQPQIELKTMTVQAVEALVRWHHPGRGLLLPAEFIPFAEESALIVALGSCILARACRDLKAWHEELQTPPRLVINVSAREVLRADVCGAVTRAAAAVGLQPSSLEVEFTETAVLANPARAAEVAACLRAAGVTVALDDFGTGYSSLTHLRELPFDRVKIDRSFVSSCLTDRSSAAIVVAVTHLVHDLGMEVVAEGVETQEQLEYVRAVGCDAVQGYCLARPLSFSECTAYLVGTAAGG
jgi:diguanylate cyclase (GGDEF)-like protein